jgi:hypothetical protein
MGESGSEAGLVMREALSDRRRDAKPHDRL